ncbi:hypothetical protein T265_04837 [Opisthorchis viverrini]|uniref:Uncharacterized protein n=1 Tax=Opisthorchis viverrini TaxID=6198 RepID=A0A075AG23_OPIVI|nr:hypothetical protein T265_04837 [Opisthorchis viverrini]KER28309.1 hypothetical protein T265_04837 [Opisthorchis viverrini]
MKPSVFVRYGGLLDRSSAPVRIGSVHHFPAVPTAPVQRPMFGFGDSKRTKQARGNKMVGKHLQTADKRKNR